MKKLKYLPLAAFLLYAPAAFAGGIGGMHSYGAPSSMNLIMQQYQCHNDQDCVETPHGCTIRSTPMGQNALNSGFTTVGNCMCLMGPVMFGCVPRTHNLTIPQKNDNYKQ